ncbi:hypothetical protein BC629DRAFT_1453193 [Irpex lacteus]|nr:hypothetical protein BC629DRAFT_1453193 [Irpex lacteus]
MGIIPSVRASIMACLAVVSQQISTSSRRQQSTAALCQAGVMCDNLSSSCQVRAMTVLLRRLARKVIGPYGTHVFAQISYYNVSFSGTKFPVFATIKA